MEGNKQNVGTLLIGPTYLKGVIYDSGHAQEFSSNRCFLPGILGSGRRKGAANARLTGVVKDSSGATVAGATIKLTNEGTNVTRATTSDSDVAYLFSLVDVGTYKITGPVRWLRQSVQCERTMEPAPGGSLHQSCAILKECKSC
jgi:hypothetical protein